MQQILFFYWLSQFLHDKSEEHCLFQFHCDLIQQNSHEPRKSAIFHSNRLLIGYVDLLSTKSVKYICNINTGNNPKSFARNHVYFSGLLPTWNYQRKPPRIWHKAIVHTQACRRHKHFHFHLNSYIKPWPLHVWFA